MDVHVATQIFENCLKKELAGKTRILVTHQLQYLNEVDKILVMQGGTITESGSHEELMEKKGEYARLINNFIREKEKGGEGEKEGKKEVEEEKKEAKKPKESKIVSVEEREVGKLESRVYTDYIASIGGTLLVGLILLVFVFEMGTKIGSDFWLSYWTGDPNSQRHGVAFYLSIYAAWGIANCFLVFAR